MQQLDLKHHVKTILLNSNDVTCDEFGNWNAGFKSQLSDLHSKHGSELIDTLKECILEMGSDYKSVEMLLCDVLIKGNFVCDSTKSALLEVLNVSKESTLRALALDALRQSYDPIEEFKLLYENEQDEDIKYDMQTTILDAKRSSFSDMLSTRESFNCNPEEFENLFLKT